MSPPHPARSRGPIGGWLGLAAYGAVWAAVWAAFSVASAYITLAGVGREGFADVAIVAGFVLLAGVSRVLMGEGAPRAAAYALVPLIGVFVLASFDAQDVRVFCLGPACVEPQLRWMERAPFAIPLGAASAALLVLLRRREPKLLVPGRSGLPAILVCMAGLSSLAAFRTGSRSTDAVSFLRSLKAEPPLLLDRLATQDLGTVLGVGVRLDCSAFDREFADDQARGVFPTCNPPPCVAVIEPIGHQGRPLLRDVYYNDALVVRADSARPFLVLNIDRRGVEHSIGATLDGRFVERVHASDLRGTFGPAHGVTLRAWLGVAVLGLFSLRGWWLRVRVRRVLAAHQGQIGDRGELEVDAERLEHDRLARHYLGELRDWQPVALLAAGLLFAPLVAAAFLGMVF